MSKTTKFIDGTVFPLMGLGVMLIPDAEVPSAMRTAAALGYRSFDTAPVYKNEKGGRVRHTRNRLESVRPSDHHQALECQPGL